MTKHPKIRKTPKVKKIPKKAKRPRSETPKAALEKRVRVPSKEKAPGAIDQAWLQWVGRQHYEDAAGFVDEMLAQGVSKKVPSLGIAQNLMKPGTVVFLAHDDGEVLDCPHCHEVVVCGTCDGAGRVKNEKGHTVDCVKCEGKGDYAISTGGWITFDGEEMMYREFLARCKKDPVMRETIDRLGLDMKSRKTKKMLWEEWGKRCMKCSGSGRMPQGFIFGMFRPSAIEYILRPEDGEEVEQEMADKKVKTVTLKKLATEARRGCGYRQPGGIYVVTEAGQRKPSENFEKAIEELIERGAISPKGYEVVGDFVRFLAPIPIEGQKRFRGIAKWALDPLAEEEAQMALEAIEDEAA